MQLLKLSFARLIFRGVLMLPSQLTAGISVSHLQASWWAIEEQQILYKYRGFSLIFDLVSSYLGQF